jgi:hypothetical protein
MEPDNGPWISTAALAHRRQISRAPSAYFFGDPPSWVPALVYHFLKFALRKPPNRAIATAVITGGKVRG